MNRQPVSTEKGHPSAPMSSGIWNPANVMPSSNVYSNTTSGPNNAQLGVNERVEDEDHHPADMIPGELDEGYVNAIGLLSLPGDVSSLSAFQDLQESCATGGLSFSYHFEPDQRKKFSSYFKKGKKGWTKIAFGSLPGLKDGNFWTLLAMSVNPTGDIVGATTRIANDGGHELSKKVVTRGQHHPSHTLDPQLILRSLLQFVSAISGSVQISSDTNQNVKFTSFVSNGHTMTKENVDDITAQVLEILIQAGHVRPLSYSRVGAEASSCVIRLKPSLPHMPPRATGDLLAKLDHVDTLLRDPISSKPQGVYGSYNKRSVHRQNNNINL